MRCWEVWGRVRESVFCDVKEASEVLSLLGNRGRRRVEGGGEWLFQVHIL